MSIATPITIMVEVSAEGRPTNIVPWDKFTGVFVPRIKVAAEVVAFTALMEGVKAGVPTKGILGFEHITFRGQV